MFNYLIKIEYIGTKFVGWQYQKNGSSVQEKIETALKKVFNYKIRVNGAGRTDKGVHAFGQFANFITKKKIDVIEIKVSDKVGVEIMAPPGMEDMTSQLSSMFSNMGAGRSKPRRVSVKSALKILKDEEAAKLVNEDELKTRAIEVTEQTAIVFIDEIDKVAQKNETHGGGVSREGVQRDLLPLIEGSTVSTKYGSVKN